MSISTDLKVLAAKLEMSSDDLLAKAAEKGPEVLEKAAQAIAAASTLLEEVADDFGGPEITPEKIDEIAAVAASFYESGDELLMKQAAVLDDIILAIGNDSNVFSKLAKNDEAERLREKLRNQKTEEAYTEPKKH